jgi:transcriptional regulator
LSIYTPRSFAAPDAAAIARLFDEYPFATLITPGDPEPFISHLPLQHRPAPGADGVLLGHMARANPHWQNFGKRTTVAVFHGPHTYVSPSFYADPGGAVPTWNYAVAHVHGVAEPMDNEAETRALLHELVHRYEDGRAQPWRLQFDAGPQAGMVGAIVGFRLVIERIEAKFKLSQNRSAEDRERVIRELRADGHAEAEATAAWMERYARERS